MSTAAAYLEYDDASHRYYADGKEFPSVTTILNAAGLITDFCKQDSAADRGRAVHEFTACDDMNPLDLGNVPEALRGYLQAWRKYRIDTGFAPDLIEYRVDNLVHGYSGRFDRMGTRRGTKLPVLLDIKTSIAGQIPSYARLQLAAYALAYAPNRLFERVCVALKPDGNYVQTIYPLASHIQDRSEWLRLVEKVRHERAG